MNAIFLRSNQGFPVKKDGRTYLPIQCVGGFFFANDKPEKLAVVQELGLEYEIKPLSEVEMLPLPELPEEVEGESEVD